MNDIAGRQVVVPTITYPEALPVSARREEIAAAIRDHQVVVVAGETGSGKTTQLPKICLELGRGVQGVIGHTQPRRLAARTVAARIAAELGVELGGAVGYQVRFSDRISDQTAVKLMTDGILLAEIQRDRLLRRYDTIIIDEAHERSLNIDFLLGYLRRLLPRRPDLKLVITSATIDVDSFSRHFDGAPVIEVSGRTWPVRTEYLARDGDADDALEGQLAGLVDEIVAGRYGERGDILVFLPGERDIRELARALRGGEGVEVLPLYARLSHAEQAKVFEPAGRRGVRVVLATNVAETSLTVPGIRYVIDPGLARVSRYSHRSRLQRLPIEPVSQASANQRQGRCGRVGPGVCLRLYSEQDFLSRPEYTEPEIQRTNLAAVVLQMLSLGLGKVTDFPFIDPPDARLVRDGYRLLEELGAVNDKGRLTRAGQRMARLPVDPSLARMVLAAARLGCAGDVLVIASALAVQDPRERPADQQQQADQMHARFRDPRSDFIGWLNLWRYYEAQRQALGQNQLRKLCRREFLSFLRLREWRDVHSQLTIACRQGELVAGAALRVSAAGEEDYQGVHKALLSGLLGNIAQRQEGREYLGSRNRKLQIFPGSALARKPPPWLVAAEIVETSRVYARTAGAIEPDWALDINPGLLQRQYYEPRWVSRRGQVMAYERVNLHGLTLADRRMVHYGPIEPALSRELLIREGLVAGNYRAFPEFLKHNQRLAREVQDLESRTRRRDILVDDEALFAFYDERLPPDICTAGRLEAWVKREPGQARTLYMNREHLVTHDPQGAVLAQFPDRLQWHDLEFRLSYEFDPGASADGVSVTVPVGLLNRAPRHLFGWLVPGLLREKCIQLLKGLPKEKRKRFVPVPDYADRALAGLEPADRDLLEALTERLNSLAGTKLERGDWAPEKLDDYYRMNVRVVDARGKLLAQDRDLEALVRRFRRDEQAPPPETGGDSPARDGITRWDFGDLPVEWRRRQAGMDIVSYPALADRGDSVSIVLCDYPGQARASHRLGVLRLLRLASAQQDKYLRKQCLRGNARSLALAAAQLEREPLLDDLVDASFLQAAAVDAAMPRTGQAFAELLACCRGEVASRALEIEAVLGNCLDALAVVRRALEGDLVARQGDSRADIEGQLQGLLLPHFLRDTPPEWLAQYPRYLKALVHRVERFSGQQDKDRRCAEQLAGLTGRLAAGLRQRPLLLGECASAAEYRWLLEEFRVSLFAQHLGTRRAVSEKRLGAKWGEVEAWLAANPY